MSEKITQAAEELEINDETLGVSDTHADTENTDAEMSSDAQTDTQINDDAPEISHAQTDTQISSDTLEISDAQTDTQISSDAPEISEAQTDTQINDDAPENTNPETKSEAQSDTEEAPKRISIKIEAPRFNKKIKKQENPVQAFFKNNALNFLLGILALILLTVFAMWAEHLHAGEEYSSLEGYVAINHKLPDDFKGTVPEELKKIIDAHDPLKRLSTRESIERKKNSELLMGEQFPEKLNNKDLFLILEYQNIGPVTKAGVERTEEMNLSGLDLRAIDFTYLNNFVLSNMRQANMTGIKNENANFRAAFLEKSLLNNSNLKHSSFVRAKLSETQFKNSELCYSDFRESTALSSQFTGSQMYQVDFLNADLRNSEFSNTNLKNSNFKNSKLDGSFFINANLENANFRKSTLRAVDFRDANLQNVDFSYAILDGANFNGADLRGAIFDSALITSANFKEAKGISIEQLRASKNLVSAKAIPQGLQSNKFRWRARFEDNQKFTAHPKSQYH